MPDQEFSPTRKFLSYGFAKQAAGSAPILARVATDDHLGEPKRKKDHERETRPLPSHPERGEPRPARQEGGRGTGCQAHEEREAHQERGHSHGVPRARSSYVPGAGARIASTSRRSSPVLRIP
jgi:hypothetical protein